jgi:hypothetical protein
VASRRALGALGALALCVTIPSACAPRAAAPPPLAAIERARGAPIFSGAPPKRLVLEKRVLGVSPDGTLRFLIRARFLDARGTPTILLGGGDVAFDIASGTATAQWQTRLRFGGPAAIVSFDRPGSATLLVRAAVGAPLAPVRVRLDTREWNGPRVVAEALGPHAIQLGWFPGTNDGTIRVVRRSSDHANLDVLTTSSSLRDGTVEPGRAYRYEVSLGGRARVVLRVSTPAEPPFASFDRFGGKAMWLSFSPSPFDAHAYARLDPNAIVARARASGIRAIELRVAYGPFSQITPEDRATIDASIDAATSNGIAVLAWTVPRSTAFEDLATAVRMARYRTARGAHFAGLAVDLERGDDYLGNGAAGYAALGAYLGGIRAALGPRYPLVATVEDPFLEHLTGTDYPYRAIARDASVLQPMAYWRMLSKRAVTPAAVRAALRGSYAATLREAGRNVPIDIGGQTAAEGPRGAPPAGEIDASIDESRRLGALGITFFDWTATSDAQWRAIARREW